MHLTGLSGGAPVHTTPPEHARLGRLEAGAWIAVATKTTSLHACHIDMCTKSTKMREPQGPVLSAPEDACSGKYTKNRGMLFVQHLHVSQKVEARAPHAPQFRAPTRPVAIFRFSSSPPAPQASRPPARHANRAASVCGVPLADMHRRVFPTKTGLFRATRVRHQSEVLPEGAC